MSICERRLDRLAFDGHPDAMIDGDTELFMGNSKQ